MCNSHVICFKLQIEEATFYRFEFENHIHWRQDETALFYFRCLCSLQTCRDK